MIKYLGSKRRLVPVLGALADAVSAQTAVDLFTGTTRVAQEFRSRGCTVTAVDVTHYSEVFAGTYVAMAPDDSCLGPLDSVLAHLDSLPGVDGYVTEVFGQTARFIHPDNGRRVDAIRAAIASDWAGSPLEPVLLTSLVEAADRVDSTAGVQMAYLKAWAPRATQRLTLRRPEFVNGPPGRAVRGDAVDLAGVLPATDLAYLDPPYNQHRYDANYHVWETIVRNDAPEHYGVACKRTDLRDLSLKSPFNNRKRMPEALAEIVGKINARVIALSYNDESWLSADELMELCRPRGEVQVLSFESKRYIGAQIGIHNPAGQRVGTVGRLRNTEYLVVTGDMTPVERARIAALEA